MEDYSKHIAATLAFMKNEGDSELLKIPSKYTAEVAMGACILDCYTNFEISRKNLCVKGYTDDGDNFLKAYLYGAIQLADTFGTEDYQNYYDLWVSSVVMPAVNQFMEG